MNKTVKYLATLPLLWSIVACDQPGMEYDVAAKQLVVQESTIYIDGFLVKDEPVFAGNDSLPADRIGISFVNGFGRNLTVKFVDRSAETGLTFTDGEAKLLNQGDNQYAFFTITGTPKQEGNVPVSFEIFENGEKIGSTITKTIPVWSAGTARPSRDLIPTAERPFILVEGEVNWINQSEPTATAKNDQEMWFARMVSPQTQFKVGGLTYFCCVNLRYNSILIADKSIRPAMVDTEGGVRLNLYLPTQENLDTNPEAFTLKDGNKSQVWSEGDLFYHGTNSKPVSVSMWDPNTPDIVVSGSRSRPMSSLSWTISTASPLSRISKPGTYKLYVQYTNTDDGVDIIQYFPKHPVTGEPGWVPYEFTVSENPLPGFKPDPGITSTDTPGVPTFNADWMPTEADPIKAVRGELVANHMTKALKKGVKLGANGGYVRIWFVSYKAPGATVPPGWNFKAHDDTKTNWYRGFYTPDVVAVAGANSKVGAGTANQISSKATHFFDDEELESKYFVTYVDFNADANMILNKAGTFTFMFDSAPNSGTASPKFENGFSCPVTFYVTE